MTSYTGEMERIPIEITNEFPMTNPLVEIGAKSRECFAQKILGTDSAIGTDDYTYTILDAANRGLILEAAWVVFDDDISVDDSNYLTLAVESGGVTLCQVTTEYGVVANEPFEIQRVSTEAQRTLAADDQVDLVITGTGSGQAIPDAQVFLVGRWA